MGWILLGLLGLVLLALTVVLVVRIQFSGEVSVSAHFDESEDQSELAWLAALDPAAAEALGLGGTEGGEGEELDYALRYAGRLRILGLRLRVGQDGVYVFGRRLGGPRAAAGSSGAQARRDRPTGKTDVRRGTGRRRRRWERHEQQRPTQRRRQPELSWRLVRRLWPPTKQALLSSWAGLGLRLRLRLTYGLGEPATTGILAGLVPAAATAALSGINQRRPDSVVCRFVPVFDREVLVGEFELSGDTRLIRVIWPMLRLVMRREVRQLWWPRRRGARVG